MITIKLVRDSPGHPFLLKVGIFDYHLSLDEILSLRREINEAVKDILHYTIIEPKTINPATFLPKRKARMPHTSMARKVFLSKTKRPSK